MSFVSPISRPLIRGAGPVTTMGRWVHTTSPVTAKVSLRKQEIRASIKKAQEEAVLRREERRKLVDTPFLNSLIDPQKLFQSTLESSTRAPIEEASEAVPRAILGLTTDDQKFLLESVPQVKLTHSKLANEDDTWAARTAAENVAKVLSLENAGSPEITKWNKQLAVRTFGRKEHDTGSSEVQAAIWTIRINNLKLHLLKNPKDKYNCRRYIMLQHKRAKILRYLKRCSLERYAKCIKQLGLRPEMVEEQIKPISRVTEEE
ncbi:hypothetical protein H4R33_003031 [Dimargaris cristalligena]|nr:hypothetical protein H4R33_003031 [Dimargaris cristalligena]